MDMLGEWRLVGVGGVFEEGGVARSMAIIVGECAVMVREYTSWEAGVWLPGDDYGRPPTLTLWMK